MSNYSNRELYPDGLVFRAAELFLEKSYTALQLSEKLLADYPKVRGRVTRETVYDIVGEAIHRQFLRLMPPLDKELAQRLQEKFPLLTTDTTHVVEMAGPQDDDKVAKVAAQLAFSLLPDIRKGCPNREIGIGLGPGRATRDFCLHFSELLKNNPDTPAIRLVAISGGGPAYFPEFASSSFFNFFPRQSFSRPDSQQDDRLKIGLFSPTLVHKKDLNEIKTRVGVKEAVAAIDLIDLVVTAMGDMNDPHDLLGRSLLESLGAENLSALMSRTKMVGNIQYRPYSDTGPIEELPDDWRAVTLFEIDKLVELAKQRHKHVILIARQCGLCGTSRARAVRPLVTLPKMKAFSHLVVDSKTAGELLQELPVAEALDSAPSAPAAPAAPAVPVPAPRPPKARTGRGRTNR